MKKVILVTILTAGFLFAECSDDNNGNSDGENETFTGVLSGTVQGQSFIAKGGKIFDDSFNNEELFAIHVTNIETACDSKVFSYEYRVSTDVPRKVGTYTKRNVAFIKKGEKPMNVLQSTVIIDEITDDTISFRIKSDSSSENKVEGKYTLPYCK